MSAKKKVGILGFGSVGQFLFDKILNDPGYSEIFEPAFIWNRSEKKYESSGFNDLDKYILKGESLNKSLHNYLINSDIDIIVEVSHPVITKQIGSLVLDHCDYFPSSLSIFADDSIKEELFNKARSNNHHYGLYLPVGAAWGTEDISKMAKSNSLTGLEISMKFNTSALNLNEPLKEKLENYITSDDQKEVLLYSGSVKNLAKLAPNNVNTMCCLALAAENLGMEKVKGNLYAKKQGDEHIVLIETQGLHGFKVRTERNNPAKKGAVTGKATYQSFLNSLIASGGKGNGVWFC